MDNFSKINKHVVLNKHVGWKFQNHVISVNKCSVNSYNLTKIVSTKINIYFPFKLCFTLTDKWKNGFFFLNCMLSGIFLGKLINVWSQIRPCWLDFFQKINRRVDMIIRATRVKIWIVWSFPDILVPLLSRVLGQ